MPDRRRIARYQRVPELGPRLLFFSGGTALTDISRELKTFTYNSIHLVTPFDSGGSSAKLRDAFDMPAIGDLRSRIMSLADETILGNPDVVRLFAYRFPADAEQSELVQILESLISGNDKKISSIGNPMRRLIRNHLGYFRNAMPKDFDLRGASIGNLVLAGGYLNNSQKLDSIVFLFSRLVGVRGTVQTVTNDNLHLAAELADGKTIVGQHKLTGKETSPLKSPIKRVFLSRQLNKPTPIKVDMPKKKRGLIKDADLICYPPGSLFSSILANLLPGGVGKSVAMNGAPKVYIPSLGRDPEQLGLSLSDSVDKILSTLRGDTGIDCPTDRLLNFVLLDTKSGKYPIPMMRRAIRKKGIEIIDTPLISEESAPYYDPKLVVSALLSISA